MTEPRTDSGYADAVAADVLASGLPSGEIAGGQRVAAELEAALARHLLGGRIAADIGQTGVAVVAIWILWSVLGPTLSLAWLGAFLLNVVLRLVFRTRAIGPDTEPAEVLSIVRRDVWLSGTMWGILAFLAMGAPLLEMALLQVVFAGLVAAGTSTLVADGKSFVGFTLLLLGPLAVSVLLGGTDPQHVMLVALILLFAPFMVVAYRRAFGLLEGQIRTATRLRMSEEETARSRDFVTALVSSAPSPIVVLDKDGHVLQANPAFHHVTRQEEDSVTGRSLMEIVTMDPATQSAVRSYLDTVRHGARSVAEMPLERWDGTRIWLRVSGTRARGMAEGNIVLVAEDVTEQVAAREAMESARRQAEEAARAKSSFLASMSHEIRTPMNGILGMIELLLDSALTDPQREAAEVIRSSGQGLLRILNDILDVSKIEAGQMDLEEVEFDLLQMINDTARMLAPRAAERQNELLVDIGPDLPGSVVGDPTRVRQVLTNLLGNAVKFTHAGEVVLSARSVSAEAGTHAVEFRVRDTGVGIPPEKQQMIFQEFEQADSSTTRTHGGTGLGLTISRRLVELMGGSLELASEVGKGSEFSFTLELGEADGRTSQRPRTTPGGGTLRGLRFIVVDDNATARRIVREALLPMGVACVDEAKGVDAGLARLRSGAEDGNPYHAVILDHMMPDRDGFDLARELRGDPSIGTTPILMVTSTGLGSAKATAKEIGVEGFLSKPVSRADLIRALAGVLRAEGDEGQEKELVTEATIATSPTGKRVLLAEDNTVNQQVAIALLERKGYEVEAVPNGAQAVEAARANRYDIVLMDIQMPVMDGLEATRQIRAIPGRKDLPVVALTAHAFAEERQRCADAGMDDFLAKPFKPDDLYDLVERWTQRTAAEPGAPQESEVMNQEQGEAPAVDIEGFRAIMREAGIEDIVDSTLEIYRSEAPQIFQRLQAAVQSGDADAVRAQAHSLKSSSGNIRANRLAELLQQLEGLGRDGDLAAIGELFTTVEEEYGAVLDCLAREAG